MPSSPKKKPVKKKGGGLSAGIGWGGKKPDKHGELELRLEVNGHEGSCWISKEFWEAIAEKAGWFKPPTVLSVLVPSEQRDRELLVIGTAVSLEMSIRIGSNIEMRPELEEALMKAVAQWRGPKLPPKKRKK